LNLKNYLENFIQNCKIYSKELLVDEIQEIVNSDKSSRSYDDLRFGIILLNTGYIAQLQLLDLKVHFYLKVVHETTSTERNNEFI